jgi:hypothetical protein
LFDGDALVPDAATPPPDFSVVVDMAAPPDLASPNDLMLPCQFTIFNGLGDAGAYDCPCGCSLDPFSAAPSSARWIMSGTPGWSVNANNGTLQFVRSASNGDAVALTGNYQLQGDFDLRVDYFIAAMSGGGRAAAVAYGPLVGSAYEPTAAVALYNNGMVLRYNLLVDDSVHDIGGATVGGTFRLHRTGSQLCAEVMGVDSVCKSVTEPTLHWYLIANESLAGCTSCAVIDVHYSNLLLLSGRLVP